jgi:preprotein translocase subunit SecF
MNKILTGIVSALLVVGIAGIYIPNVSATMEFCSGNSALAQEGSSMAEQSPVQGQASGSEAQSIAQEFNALTGNSLNLNDQQNGNCLSPLTGLENENPLAATTDLQNSTTN